MFENLGSNQSISNILLNSFHSSPEHIAILNQHSEFIHMNPAYMHTIGYTKIDDILGLSYDAFKGKAFEQANDYKIQDQQVLGQTQSLEFLTYHRYADGQWRLLHGSKSCIFDQHQNPCGIFSRTKDVTKHPLFDIGRFLMMSSTTSKIKHQSFIYYINPINNKYSISRKELEILFYFIRGKTASEIALILNRSKRTIDMHIESIKNKFVVENKSHLIEKAMIEGYMNLLPETFIEKHHD